MLKYKERWNKNEMMRLIVVQCIQALQLTGYVIVGTKLLVFVGAYIQAILNQTMIELLQALDWSTEATFIAAAFGGELLLGMVKKFLQRKEIKTMNDYLKKRLAALCSVKSIVTIVLTAVFAYLAITKQITQEFMVVYTVVIAFYFGTQSQKVQDIIAKKGEDE